VVQLRGHRSAGSTDLQSCCQPLCMRPSPKWITHPLTAGRSRATTAPSARGLRKAICRRPSLPTAKPEGKPRRVPLSYLEGVVVLNSPPSIQASLELSHYRHIGSTRPGAQRHQLLRELAAAVSRRLSTDRCASVPAARRRLRHPLVHPKLRSAAGSRCLTCAASQTSGATWQARDPATMRFSPLVLGLALSQLLTLAGFVTLLGGLGAPSPPSA